MLGDERQPPGGVWGGKRDSGEGKKEGFRLRERSRGEKAVLGSSLLELMGGRALYSTGHFARNSAEGVPSFP